MSDTNKIKLQLKEWEAAFYKVHQRKPAKEDINQAPNSIKELYKAYHSARRSSGGQKESFSQVGQSKRGDAENQEETCADSPSQSGDSRRQNVWGPEFNKKLLKTDAEKEEEDRPRGRALLDTLGDRLFAKSSGTASNVFVPKKKPQIQRPENWESTDRHRDDSPLSSPQHSQHSPYPAGSTSASTSVAGTFTSAVFSPSDSEEFKISDSEEFKIKGGMFEKAMMRLTTGKRASSFDDAELPNKFVQASKPKKRISLIQGGKYGKLSELGCDSGSELGVLGSPTGGADTVSSAWNTGWDEVDGGWGDGERKSSQGFSGERGNRNSFNIDAKKRDGLFGSGDHNSGAFSNCDDLDTLDNVASRKVSSVGKCRKSVPRNTTSITNDEEQSSLPTSKRRTTSKCQESHMSISSIVGPEGVRTASQSSRYSFCEDDDAERGSDPKTAAEDPEFVPEGPAGSAAGRQKGRVAGKRKGESATTRTRKRRKVDGQDADDGMVEATDHEEVDEAGPSKKATKPRKETKPSTLSAARRTDNFVRLNMKVKRFVRKGSRMTGGQLKRKQWKARMAARSKSYGDRCFKCGQSGHWANKCPGNSQGGQINIEGDITAVDDNDFPTLRSAALMARGIKTDDVEPEMDEEMAVEAMVTRERFEPEAVNRSPLTPFTHLVDDVEDEVQNGLDKFGFSSFKPGQKKTVMRILNGQSTLLVLSTGGGKSLCYQLPAYLYAQKSRGVTLVVSPLVSLMEDQVTGLPPGVEGACLHSSMTPTQRDRVLADVHAGKVHFLLVSPEAVVGGGGRGQGSFPSADKLPPIFFACIDEVHCLSEWSHNFRPSYLRLCRVLQDKYGVTCFLGLTATATRSTAEDVARHLAIEDLEEAMIRGSPVPPNLRLSVSRDENKEEGWRPDKVVET